SWSCVRRCEVWSRRGRPHERAGPLPSANYPEARSAEGRPMTIPRVIAHRGSSAAHPDNSWAAFEAAVTEDADTIECDVVATRDDVLVVRHDLSVGDRFVSDVTALELGAIEPGTIRLAELLPWAVRVRIDL